MKKILSALLIISSPIYSQIIKEFPVDETGRINFNEVIEIDGKTKDELYYKSKEFFVNSFKSANDVIQLDDKENAIIIGKGKSKIIINAGMGVTIYPYMNYTIKIQCKDNKIKYDIYNISYTSDYGDVPAEGWFIEKNYFKKNGKAKSINEKYKEQTLFVINELKLLINSIKSENSSKKDW